MIFFFISLSTYLCFLILKYRVGLMALEKSKFNLKKYNKWICDKKNFITFELLAIILIIVAFNLDAKITGICVVIFYTLMYLYLLKKKEGKFKPKGKSVGVIALAFVFYLLVFGGFYLDYLDLQNDFLIFDDSKFYYLIIIILGYFSYYVIFALAFIVNVFSSLIKKIKKRAQVK